MAQKGAPKYGYESISWVWFDIDDTIVDFTSNSRQAMDIVYGMTPLLKGLFSSAEAWIETYERHNRQLWARFNNGEINSSYLRVQRFIGPLTEAGCPTEIAHENAAPLDAQYLDILAAQPGMIDGSADLIEGLHKLGLKIGVLSNGFSGIQEKKLVTAGVAGLIDCVVLSDQIDINKPDRRIFEYAMRKTAESNPESHLMIGDNPVTDIAGAINAGWRAIHFDSGFNGMEIAEGGAVRVGSLRLILPLFMPKKPGER